MFIFLRQSLRAVHTNGKRLAASPLASFTKLKAETSGRPAALQGVGSGVPIRIATDNSIRFTDVGSLSRQTGSAIDAALTTT